jgi:hypothetical protein
MKELRKDKGNHHTDPLPEEADILIKEMREVHKLIRSRIDDIAQKNPEIHAQLNAMYADVCLGPFHVRYADNNITLGRTFTPSISSDHPSFTPFSWQSPGARY